MQNPKDIALKLSKINIKNYGTENEPLFKANDIGDLITTKIKKSLHILNNNEKILMIAVTKGGPQKQWFLTSKGLIKVICNSRKETSIRLANFIGIECDIKIPCKESQFSNQIKKAFQHYEICEQYPCLNYRIDFYLPRYKLAIEFDENHHQLAINKHKDFQRQVLIENELKCRFLRVNHKDDIFDIINKIIILTTR